MALTTQTNAVVGSDDNPREMGSWVVAYCVALALSAISSLASSIHMLCHARKRLRMTRSAVRFVIWNYMITTSLHAWMTLTFYIFLLMVTKQLSNLFEEWIDESTKAAIDYCMGSNSTTDAGAQADIMSRLIHATQSVNMVGLLIAVNLDNLTVVLCAYWILLLTFELFRLTLSTFDRGASKELTTIKWYTFGGFLLLAVLIGTGFVLWSIDDGLDNGYRYFAMVELAFGVGVIIYASGSLLYLKHKGRQLEVVQGVRIRSPLYRRLKSLMIVCVVFTLPYLILQTILLGMTTEEASAVPDSLVGICTILYYLFGTAQAIILGTSQACCFQILSPLMPTEIRDSPEFRHLRHSSLQQAQVNLTDGPNLAIEPPSKDNVVFVNTDIESSSALWAQADEEVMEIAQALHDDLLRLLLIKHRGYEITTCGDAFQLAFHSIQDAVEYCLSVQLELLEQGWPSELEEMNVAACQTERLKSLSVSSALPKLDRGQLRLKRSGRFLFHGLRVRMGIHDAHADEGSLVLQTHPVTGKTVYIGASELIGREVGDVGFGGEIMVSHRIAEWLRVEENKKLLSTPCVLRRVGWHEVTCLELSVALFELLPSQLKDRASVFHDRQHELSGKIDFLAPKTSLSTTATSVATGVVDDADEEGSLEEQADGDAESSTTEESLVDAYSVHSSDSFVLLTASQYSEQEHKQEASIP